MRGRPIKPPVIEYELKPDVDVAEVQRRLDRIFEILFDDMVNSYPKGTGSFKSIAESLPAWKEWKLHRLQNFSNGEGGDNK